MTDVLSQAALSLSAFPLSTIAKATVILAAGLLGIRCARRARAATRHFVLASAFAVVLALPVTERAVPAVTLSVGTPVAPAAPKHLPIVMSPDFTAPQAAPAPAGSIDASSQRARPSMEALLIAAWAIGASLFLTPVLVTPGRLRQLRGTARRWHEGEDLVRAIGSGVHRPVAVLIHEEAAAPLTCGIVRPAIVLPSQALTWADQEVRQALVHELEHIRRADWPVHIATRVVCAIYWFNPLAWIAWRQLALEAERACDDAVLRIAERTAYAQQLVTLARHARSSPVPALSMVSRSELSERISALLDEAQARGRLGFRRAATIVAIAGLAAAAVVPLRAAAQASVRVQDPTTLPSFDVVSIKENKSGDTVQGSRRQPGRIVITNVPLRLSIINFFGLQPQQLIGGPDWINSTRYDIIAQFSGEMPLTEPGSVGPLQLMMQRVFAERFKLAVHTETREIPVYELTQARRDRTLGSKLKPAATDCEAVMSAMLKSAREGGPPPTAGPQLPDGRPACGMRFGPGNRLVAGGTSMAALSRNMSNPAGRIIVDKTGLIGGFDFELEFTPDPSAAGGQPPAVSDTNLPSLFTALEEQLGLKLVPERRPVEVLVIDGVERPTEN
jgi:bla regulator protein blaR1